MDFDKAMIINIILGLFGGLAIFIYGMNLMSEGLQKSAGERMRTILEVLPSNPLIAVLVGTLVTTVLQSSSATTVMVVGFVSAGLMSLKQGIAVIMGANIGTTITAQLIAFNVGHYAYAFVAIGFIFYFFSKKNLAKYIGQTVFAFGLLFTGLNIMSSVMKPLSQSRVFADLIINLSNYPILGLLVGTFMTIVIQSSSATIAILQNAAGQPINQAGDALINLTTAIPILIGDSIGTTITALFATIGAKVNAKRAAIAHSVFNLIGALIFISFTPIFAKMIQVISPKGPEYEIIGRQIANVHTAFNVLNTILWLPFIWVLAKIVTFIVKDKNEGKTTINTFLDPHALPSPAIAMNLATKELGIMLSKVKEMLILSCEAFLNANTDNIKRIDDLEDEVDDLQKRTVNYLTNVVSKKELTSKQSIRLAGLIQTAGDIERLADHCKNISEFAQLRTVDNIVLSEEASSEISDFFNKIRVMIDDSTLALSEEDLDKAKEVIKNEDSMDMIEKKLRESHIERHNKGLCDSRGTIMYIELIHNIERMADHCNNIAEAVLEDHNIKQQQ